MQDPMNSPGYIQRLILASEAYRIEQRLHHLDSLFFVYDRSYHELHTFLKGALNSDNLDLLWKTKEATVILREVMRLVHNFVASARMLVELTRPIIREWYKGTPFITKYSEQIETRFIHNPLSKFVEDLRNYILHYNLPITGARVQVKFNETTGQQEETATISLNKSSLMEWGSGVKEKLILQLRQMKSIYLH